MKKHSKQIFQEYIFDKIKDSVQSSIVSGVILKVRFIKVCNISFFEAIFYLLNMPIYKDIYFWLPYKRIVEASSKYGIIGPASRFPYSNQWFEVKQNSEIYKQGLNNFVFHRKKIYKSTNELRQSEAFLASELFILTRKSIIKELDAFLFKKKQ